MVLVNAIPWKGPAMGREDAFFHYLPVNVDTSTCGMYVTGAGRVTIRPGESYPPIGHPALYQFDWVRGRTLPEFQLILITEGAGEFESEATGHVAFQGATLIFLFPGVWHRFRPVPTVGWTERWFSCNGELLHRLFDIGMLGPELAIAKPSDPPRLAADFDEMLDAIYRHSVHHPAILTFRAMRIISAAIGQRVEETLNSGSFPKNQSALYVDDPIVQKALEIIWSNSSFPMSVGDIARQLPVTRRTLDRRFVEAAGHSVLEEINTCRLGRAKRLLEETSLPVKNVAHLAGFSSSERMRVLFIERVGMSPTAYRQQVGASSDASRQRKDT
jgi:AraC-like DNA-binding protein